ncbi:hypothetical protein EOPP23_20465 [Endozoicomonas sp. OPT23]|uniref:SlyX family protein n=1 Tax=Endozoicomonas sp. OPT23 TaxID=2072845 RepID=UPI00129A9045|nr:SlyX family protein [Endozoicomonas sp. OPT23]MRI35336.1 hypothetical protein [Endozoicomonas sp. OPT23]
MRDELIELQTQVAYQEDTVSQLNDVVTRQQQEIDLLRREMEQLKQQMISLSTAPEGGQDEAPPPHY